MKYFLPILLLCCLLGCQEHKKVVSRYKNGNPEVVLHYDDKTDTTTFRKEVFYQSGKLNYTGREVKRIKEGVWTWWYENGNKKDQCKYSNGIEIDTIFHWHENGKFKRIDILLNGKVNPNANCSVCCNAKTKAFYENGNPEQEFTYRDDLLQDTSKMWYKNGKLESIIVLKNGIQNGLSEQYYANGQIKRHAIYKDDWEDGKVTEWDSLGNVVYDKYWKDKKEVD